MPLRLRDRAAAAALTYTLLGMWVTLVILVGLAAAGTDAHTRSVPIAVLVIAVVLAVGTSVPAARWLRPYVESVLWSHPESAPLVLGALGSTPGADLPAQLATRIARQLRLPYVGILESGAEPVRGLGGDRLTRIPLELDGDRLGDLVATPRGRDRALSSIDHALLEELAGQVAIVLHAVRTRDQVERSRAEVITAREEERRRIRNDLHDGLGPTLASLGLHLAALERLIPQDPDSAVGMVEGLRGEVRITSASIRELVYDLRPPLLDDVGLAAALSSWAAEAARSGGPTVAVETDDALPELPAAVEVALFRIAGEALANVRRHAHATRASVSLVADGADVLLRVEDNGRGLPEGVLPGVGLSSMRERAEELQGSFALTTIGDGTRLEVRLPLRRRP